MSDRLRIAVFVGAFPVISETFIVRQITGLLDLGHDVRIFANSRGDGAAIHESVTRYDLMNRTTFVEGPPESVFWEMPVRPVGGETWTPGASEPLSNVSRLAKAFPVLARCAASQPSITRDVLDAREYGFRARSLSGGYRLATLLNTRQRFDVLHAHFGPVANMFRFARELFRAPLVVSFHGYDFCTVPRKEGRDVYTRLWPATDRVIANSNYTSSRLRELGCPENALSILPVGLNPAAFAFRERSLKRDEPVRILTVARLVEIKGHDDAVRAVAKLRSRCPAIRYDIIGDGPLRKGLQALVDELGLSDVVQLRGAKSETEVQHFFSQAHLFLLASKTVDGDAEGQGLVLQEAQASGLPVVATQHGAFPEGVAPANTQWLRPERNPEALADALQSLIEAHATWPAIGRSARDFVCSRYDIRNLNERLVAIYRNAMKSQSREA